MALEQPAARPPQAVAGLSGDTTFTKAAPFAVPSFDEPVGEATGAAAIGILEEAAGKSKSTATTALTVATKKGKPNASPAADVGGKRVRDILRTPSASLLPSV